MAKKALTDRFVKTVPAPAAGRLEFTDTVTTGLQFRVTDKDARSWSLMYRFSGKLRRTTLGQYPAVSLAKAREAAEAIHEQVRHGIDPAAAPAPEASEKAPETVNSLIAEYQKRHTAKIRSGKEIDRLLRLYVEPKMGARIASEIGPRDIVALLDEIVDSGKAVQANRVFTVISGLLNWSVKKHLIPENPASKVEKPTEETERERVLSDDELKKVWASVGALKYPAAPLLKLLILTAQRRDEVRLMKWSEVDMESKIWTIPKDRAKNGKEHIVPLSGAAFAVMESLPRFTGEYVFSTNSGKSAYSNLIKPKAAVDKDSGVTGWTLHDLRRTAATGMGNLRVPGETIARVLNHSERAIAGITARYARADHTGPKREALEAWGRHVIKVVTAPGPKGGLDLNFTPPPGTPGPRPDYRKPLEDRELGAAVAELAAEVGKLDAAIKEFESQGYARSHLFAALALYHATVTPEN